MTAWNTTVTITRQSELDSFPINYPGCDMIDGELILQGNGIVNLNALRHIKRAYKLSIRNNSNLINLSGLDSLKYVGGLSILNNSALTSLQGLNNIDTGWDFEISNNPRLQNLVGLNSLKSVEYLEVWNDYALVNFVGLKNLKSIGSFFIVEAGPALQNFNGLDSLTDVFSLRIDGNSSITDLTGLENLRYLDNFEISGNESLINLHGLEGITAIGQHSKISYNNSLRNFYGLQNISIFYGTLHIEANPSIVNFVGLGKVNSISGLNVVGNSSLVNFTGLDSLKQIGSLLIDSNAGLKDLHGLEQLQQFGYEGMYIHNNPSLCSVNALDASLSVMRNYSSNITITDNQNLSCCKIIDTILRNNPNIQYQINSNASGCNSRTDIRSSINQNCCVPDSVPSAVVTLKYAGLHILPNPFGNTFIIEGKTDNIKEIELISVTGQKIPVQVTRTNVWLVSCGNAAKGVYFLAIHLRDDTVINCSLVKD